MQIARKFALVVLANLLALLAGLQVRAAEPEADQSSGASVMWTTRPVRIDREGQGLERLPDRRLSDPFPDIVYVPKSVRVLDSVTFSLRGEVYHLADIGPVPSQMVCRGDDGKRWACGLRARTNLRGMIAGKQFRCKTLQENGAGRAVACALPDRQSLAELLLRSGSALTLGDHSSALIEAQSFAIETRAGIWSDAEYFQRNGPAAR